MKPWEKRLRDLSILLRQCHKTYMIPDAFRLNTNQFLQTARTVTFIIQKNKKNLSDFDSWYKDNFQDSWNLDEIMRWAVDSRNKIEKEGDLELYSSLDLRLLYSYLPENDIVINLEKKELLNANIARLVQLAKRQLPEEISKSSAVKIERRWVSASLKNRELLHAMTYVYARLYECCLSFSKKLQYTPNENLLPPSCFDDIYDDSRRVEYVKIEDMKKYSAQFLSLDYKELSDLPADIRSEWEAIVTQYAKPDSLKKVVEYYAEIAKKLICYYGYHVSMLFLLNDKYEVIERMSVEFSDRVEKYLFARRIADRVFSLKAFAVVWISESWIRKYDDTGIVSNMPVIGESIVIYGMARDREIQSIKFKIDRDSDGNIVGLENYSYDFIKGSQHFFVPIRRALGLKDEL